MDFIAKNFDYVALAEMLARHIHRLQVILDAARLLNSTLDVHELTTIILETIRNEVPVDRVSVFVVDQKQNVVRSLVAQGVQIEITLPIGIGIAGFVAETRQTLDVADAYQDARFNPEFDRILGYRTNDILALPLLNGVGAAVGVLELLNRNKPITEDDHEFLRGVSIFIGLALDRAWYWRELEEKEKIAAELATYRDRLAKMDRLALVVELLSGVMHEINNPLAIVLGNVGLLKVEPGLSPKMLHYIETVEAAATRTGEAVRKFVAFTQKTKGERHPVDLLPLIRQTLDLRRFMWMLQGIEAEEHLKPVPRIIANEEEIQQALLSLIQNAECALLPHQDQARLIVRLSSSATRGTVRIDVEDNGRGVPPELQAQIFEPFFTSGRGAATDLGLTIARRIIREHGGEILFQRRPERGAIFTIELPTHLTV